MKNFISLFLLLFCLTSQGQHLYTSFGPGMTGKYLSGELQVGIRTNNVTLSAGYISMIDNSQPSLFNARAGYILGNRLHLYAGYVWVHKSNENKEMNSKTWSIGGAYHFMHYDRGTFFVSGNYSPRFVTATVGMSFNLFKQ